MTLEHYNSTVTQKRDKGTPSKVSCNIFGCSPLGHPKLVVTFPSTVNFCLSTLKPNLIIIKSYLNAFNPYNYELPLFSEFKV